MEQFLVTKYPNINAVNFIPEKNNVSTSKHTQEDMETWI